MDAVRRARVHRALFSVAALLALPAGLPRAADAAPVVAVIAHPDVPGAAIRKDELVDFYTGEDRLWDDGTPVVVFILKNKSAAQSAFYDYMDKTSSRLKSIWMKKLLAGEWQPPAAFETEDELLKAVATTPGAIGYVSAAHAREGVKTLALLPPEGR